MGQPDVRASTRKKNATNRRLAWLGQRLYCQRRLATKEEEEEKKKKKKKTSPSCPTSPCSSVKIFPGFVSVVG